MEGICAELRGVEQDEERGLMVLHVNFQSLEKELRREIIHFVYEKAEKDKKRPKNPERRPSAKQKGNRSPRATEPS
jgi:c-di-GMP-binding flagellar brake protein YcgR